MNIELSPEQLEALEMLKQAIVVCPRCAKKLFHWESQSGVCDECNNQIEHEAYDQCFDNYGSDGSDGD